MFRKLVDMGYRVRSALAIGHEDGHISFLYYVPTYAVKFEWINDWLERHFDLIAQRLGPTGVIIAPYPSSRDEYVRSLSWAVDWRALGRGHKEDRPALVVTRSPLQPDGRPEMAVVDLSRAGSVHELASLADGILELVNSGQDVLDGLPDILKRLPGFAKGRGVRKGLGWMRFFELKPNVAGIGVNFNEIAEWYRNR